MPETILIAGSCLEHLADVGDSTIDAIVTDPPYGLSKEPDICEVLKHWLAGDVYEHKGGGFMGKTWDSFVPGPEYWREFYRVLKPGGHILVFGGTRTVDLLTIAIRMGGFEIRDQLAWLYGSGFPKSLNVSKAIDKAAGAEREVIGTKRGVGGQNLNDIVNGREVRDTSEAGAKGVGAYGTGAKQVAVDVPVTAPATDEAKRWEGYGTALKPAQEPIVLARKPLIGTVAANVLEHGTGALNIDGCRIGSEVLPEQRAGQARIGTFERDDMVTPERVGRWPANVLLDEEAAALLDRQADASRFFYVAKPSRKERDVGVSAPPSTGGEATGREDGSDGLNSPRAGAGRTGGARNRHPTVKPIALMRYLIRLVTPPDGLVMDPFMGSGTTGCAAVLEGVHFLGFDLDPEYVQLAEERIAHWRADAPADTSEPDADADASEPDEDAA